MSLTTLSGTLRRNGAYIGDVIGLETRVGDGPNQNGSYFIMADGTREPCAAGLEFRPEPTPVKSDPGWYALVTRDRKPIEQRLPVVAWLYSAAGTHRDALVIGHSEAPPRRLSQILATSKSICRASVHHAEYRPEPPTPNAVRRVLSDIVRRLDSMPRPRLTLEQR